MSAPIPVTVSDHLKAALASLDRAREGARTVPLDARVGLVVDVREVVSREIVSAEYSIARAIHLIAGGAEA